MRYTNWKLACENDFLHKAKEINISFNILNQYTFVLFLSLGHQWRVSAKAKLFPYSSLPLSWIKLKTLQYTFMVLLWSICLQMMYVGVIVLTEGLFIHWQLFKNSRCIHEKQQFESYILIMYIIDKIWYGVSVAQRKGNKRKQKQKISIDWNHIVK